MALASKSRFQIAFVLFAVGLVLVSYVMLSISTHKDWEYTVAHINIESVSGIAIDGDTLYATQETRNHDGKLIAITDGTITILESSLQKPDGLTLWFGKPTYTQEFGKTFVYAFSGNRSEPIFETDGAEGIDSTRNGDLFIVEDKPSGSLLKYSHATATVTELAEGLNQAEGVCAMESGAIFYVEKSSDTIFKIEGGNTTAFISGLTKPGFLHCNEEDGGVWITEDRSNFGRLLHSTMTGSLSIVASGLKSPQGLDIDSDGSLYLAEQGRNRILKFTPSGGSTGES